MTARWRVVVVCLAAVAVAVPAAPAEASTPAPVTIEAVVTQPPFAGVWQSTGAINDAGSFLRTDAHLTGSFFNSPQAAAFQAVFVFSGAQGTLTLRFQLSFVGDDLTGVWEVASGTGAYSGNTGHGTSRFTPPNSLDLAGVIAS